MVSPNSIHTIKSHHLVNGQILDIRLAYQTFGSPTLPAVLLPTCYGGRISTTQSLISPSNTLSPDKYFIIVIALLGNGESSSPSNTPAPYGGPKFPKISYEDNIRCQYDLLTNGLGITHLKAVIGFSMGGQQAYHWAVLYPDFLNMAVCIAGSARTSWHNYCFLEGPKNALIQSDGFNGGNSTTPPTKGIKAFGRAYSAWAMSAAWFREETWRKMKPGYETLEEYLQAGWDNMGFDANDLLTKLDTWQMGNIANYEQFGGSLEKALESIKCKVLVMPVSSDQYFVVEDSVEEVKWLRKGRLSVVESVWGHMAGGGACESGLKFMDGELGKLFADDEI